MTLCDVVSIQRRDRETGEDAFLDPSEFEFEIAINELGAGSIVFDSECPPFEEFAPWCTQVAFLQDGQVLSNNWVTSIERKNGNVAVDLASNAAILARVMWGEAGTLIGQTSVVVDLILQRLTELTGYAIPLVELAPIDRIVSLSYEATDSLLDTFSDLVGSALWFYDGGTALVVAPIELEPDRGDVWYEFGDFLELTETVDGEAIATEIILQYGADGAIAKSPPDGATLADFTSCQGRLSIALQFEQITDPTEAQELADYYATVLSRPVVQFEGEGLRLDDTPTNRLQIGYYEQINGRSVSAYVQLTGITVSGFRTGNDFNHVVDFVSTVHRSLPTRIASRL